MNLDVKDLKKNGVLKFDRYKNLSKKEFVARVRHLANTGQFWQPEHISSVQGKAKNIYYPNNLQAAPGNMGAFMENFKKIASKDPTNPIIKKGATIDKILSDYNMTVRDNKTGVRLGFKDVIEVDPVTKTSNIISSNADALGNKMNILKKIGNIKKGIIPAGAAYLGTSGLGGEAEAAITYNPTIGAMVKTGTDDVASQSNLLEWAADNPEPLIAAGVGGTALNKTGNKLLMGLINKLAPLGAVGTAMTVKENMDQGESLPEALADPMAGLGMMGIGAGKLLRMGTPIGAAMTAAGLGKDYYEFAQDEIEKMNQMSDYDRGIYNEMLMDETNIDF